MNKTKRTLNELLVHIFNYILAIEEKNLKDRGLPLSMNDVHILECIQKAKDNNMSYIAKALMITQGTLTTNISKLVQKGYVVKYKDEYDKRMTRLKLTELCDPVLKMHDEFHEQLIEKATKDLGLEDHVLLNEILDNILAYFRSEYALKGEVGELEEL